jgi:2-polyprenyl-6-methoxyphenol hydroxylase-like FAD-dependent oxidoreductase
LNSPDSQIVIVGASLAGLTLALACAHRGVSVRVVERAARRVHGGDSLSVDLQTLASAVGLDPRAQPALPVVPAYRDRHLTTWPALYAWLRKRAQQTRGITLEEGTNVVAAADRGDWATISFADNSERVADAVIGADGYHSTVRRAVAPDQALAKYAGYIVWRGLVEEGILTHPVQWPSSGGLWIEFVHGYRLVAAVLPGRDGSLEPGKRQITFAWFDAHRTELLHRTGRLTKDGHLLSTIAAGTIEDSVREELISLAPRLWPEPWTEAVTTGLRSATALSGAPIAEYRPERLTHGRLALIGDAAHVVTPMTGSGYATSVEDAMVLSSVLAALSGGESMTVALRRYEAARLPYVRGLVTHSQRLSTEYMHFATSAHKLSLVGK